MKRTLLVLGVLAGLSVSSEAVFTPTIISTSMLQSGTTFYVSSGTAINIGFSTMTKQGATAYVLLYSSTVCTGVETTTTSNAFQPTNTFITLTPHQTTSRIEVSANGGIEFANGINDIVDATIMRGAAVNLALLNSSVANLCEIRDNLATSPAMIPCPMGPIFDTPLINSATTYTVYFHNSSNSASVVWGANGALAKCLSVKEWGY